MSPSSIFSIPSIGTPIHHQDPDQEIIPTSYQHQPPSMREQNISGIGNGMYGIPPLMSGKSMHTYAPSYATPQSMIQPQTPVTYFIHIIYYKSRVLNITSNYSYLIARFFNSKA